jgi:hypothetical protein
VTNSAADEGTEPTTAAPAEVAEATPNPRNDYFMPVLAGLGILAALAVLIVVIAVTHRSSTADKSGVGVDHHSTTTAAVFESTTSQAGATMPDTTATTPASADPAAATPAPVPGATGATPGPSGSGSVATPPRPGSPADPSQVGSAAANSGAARPRVDPGSAAKGPTDVAPSGNPLIPTAPTTTPGPATNVTARTTAAGSVTLTWTAPTGPRVAEYQITAVTRSLTQGPNGCEGAATTVDTRTARTAAPAITLDVNVTNDCSWVEYGVIATNNAGAGTSASAVGVVPKVAGQANPLGLVRTVGGMAIPGGTCAGQPASYGCGSDPAADAVITPGTAVRVSTA